MTVAFRVALLLLTAPLVGCVGAEDPGPVAPTGGGKPTAIEAPWWKVGAYWDVELTTNGATRTHRLVNMWNDTETAHFWLGVKDRALALDHAFFDTNPFLGRIHHNILAPHEKGMHATMYNFPVKAGDTWKGMLLDGDWELEAKADPARPGALLVTGRGADGSTIAYDYDPKTQWFRSVEIKDARGAVTLRAVVKATGAGEKGTFWFERGRDYYKGPEIRQGTHAETVTVKDEGLDYLAVHFALRASAPLEIQVLDPSGAVRERATVASASGGDVRRIIEIPSPAKGDWSIRFVTTGTIEGDIVATGLFETKKVI